MSTLSFDNILKRTERRSELLRQRSILSHLYYIKEIQGEILFNLFQYFLLKWQCFIQEFVSELYISMISISELNCCGGTFYVIRAASMVGNQLGRG